MRIFGKKIIPVSRFLGIDVRPFFVWLDRMETKWNARQKSKKLDIQSSKHKGD